MDTPRPPADARSARVSFALAYIGLVALPLVGVALVLRAGSGLTAPAAPPAAPVATAAQATLRLPVLLGQIIVILAVSRLVGMALRKLRQPQVVGEMLAGLLLGPSLLGWIAPAAYGALFPLGTVRFLGALSQVGVVLFLFLVGLELDPKLLRERGHVAVLTSHASITAPMFLGTALALLLYPRLGSDAVPFDPFALFMGAALSVTAFPVLARILMERKLQNTRLGALTIACAAIDDATAWCVLAFVVALTRAGTGGVAAWITIGGAVVYAALMLTIVRRLLARLAARASARSSMDNDLVAAVVVVTLASAWVTERLGLHALFGAFLAGVAMPKDPAFVEGLVKRFETLMLVLLLPLFFAVTGIRTHVGLAFASGTWALALAVIGVAVLGKIGGSAVAARVTGLPWREAWSLGALMNTRGLMGLIILNIGLELGVITPAIFAIMVLMAVITTVMTTPLLEWLHPPARLRA